MWLSMAVNGGNTFQTYTMDMSHSSHEFYSNSFRLIETNYVCCVRYRSLITMSMVAAATLSPTPPTSAPTPPTPAPTFATIPRTECDCNISVMNASTSNIAGKAFLNITSTASDPMGPWYYEGVLFKGSNNGGYNVVYDYAIDCVRSCWITSITIKGAAFHNTQIQCHQIQCCP